ncbi:hypothetical protein ACX8Z9_04515 [Arthrobacter halodurans]|uniref:Uncharacterized protein n=1 Tax=Arthrobacter halodurans TaxID=516699 RepID=A0ABV4UPT7_9MICC
MTVGQTVKANLRHFTAGGTGTAKIMIGGGDACPFSIVVAAAN